LHYSEGERRWDTNPFTRLVGELDSGDGDDVLGEMAEDSGVEIGSGEECELACSGIEWMGLG